MNRFDNIRRVALAAVALVGVLVAVSPGSSHGAQPLLICVDQAGTNVDLSDARRRIKDVMKRDVEEHPRFEAVGYSRASWSLRHGCPSAPSLLQSGDRHFKLGGSALIGRTDKASGVRAFVYVVPEVTKSCGCSVT